MTTHHLQTTLHDSLLNPLVGVGLLALPHEDSDQLLATEHSQGVTVASLISADLTDHAGRLAQFAFNIPEAEGGIWPEPRTGGMALEELTAGGRVLVYLECDDPICSDWDAGDWTAAQEALIDEANRRGL